MASIYLVAATDNIINEPSILTDKAGESHRIASHLETIHKLLTAIKEGRAMRVDGSPNTDIYSSYRG
jgi:hypothetical protein